MASFMIYCISVNQIPLYFCKYAFSLALFRRSGYAKAQEDIAVRLRNLRFVNLIL